MEEPHEIPRFLSTSIVITLISDLSTLHNLPVVIHVSTY